MLYNLTKYASFYLFVQFCFVLISITTIDVPAQEYTFTQLKIEDGLSQSTIFASLQDNRGYMWFATRSGLNRYDGYKFKVYYNDPKDSTSLSDDGTNSLFEDKNGTLWIGTLYGNINRYDKKNDTFIHKNINDLINYLPNLEEDYYDYPLSFSRNQLETITCIIEDVDGLLWLGTWGKGIICLDKNFKIIKHFFYDNNNASLTSNRIMDLEFDKLGHLWVATFGGGLNRISKKRDKIGAEYIIESINKDIGEFSLPDDKLLNIFKDSKNQLWIGSYYAGIIVIPNSSINLPLDQISFVSRVCPAKIESRVPNTIMTITEDKDNNIWMGTFGGGLIKFDSKENVSQHFLNDPLNANSLGDNDVLSLFTDRSGIIWAGSHLATGITKIQKNSYKFSLFKREIGNNNSLNDQVVWSIYRQANDNLFIGSYKGGINYYNYKLKKWHFLTKSDGLSSNHIRAINEDRYGNLWIGTYDGGLQIISKDGKDIKTYKNNKRDQTSLSSNQVLSFFFESDSIYWVATFGGGLNKVVTNLNPIHQRLIFNHYLFDSQNKESISDNRVYKIIKSRSSEYWVGTYGGGLNKFDPVAGKFKRYPINSGQFDKFNIENLMTIFEDSYGILWLGSYGGSLTSFDPKTEKFKRYSFREGLTSGVVYGILEDDQKNLWISSDDGIFKLNLNTKQIIRYGIQDGLQSLEFSGGAYFKDDAGTMYFGGINGVNYFNPDKITTNKFIPQVVITSINVFNETINGDKTELELDYNKNFITFEFSSLDFSDPRDNQYAYILEGLQNEWQFVDASTRMATFTNLSPGNYTFKVKGSNSDGIWSEKYASIKITILGPFYKTWWFISLLVILLASILYYISTVRIKNQLAIEKLKSKLAADLHDNIGSGLTEISILSEVANTKIKSSQFSSAAELSKISDISRQLVDNMSDIVWVVNPKRDSLHDLILRLKDSYSELLSSLGIFFRSKDLEKLETIKLPMDVKQNLYLIFKEAINNSIKHSNCKQLLLEANLRNDIIEISLTDDGNGFEENNKAKGNGLKNMENRAKLIGGKIKIKSSKDSGTSIRFIGKIGRIPKLNFLFKQ